MEVQLGLRHLEEEATSIVGALELHGSPPHLLSRRLRTRVRISARERILPRMTSSLPVATDSRALGAWLRDATPVDRVGIEERVATLKTRSIKKSYKVWAVRLALGMCDITTLEGKDTPGKIRQLATKAMRPLPGDASMPSVAALCCYPDLVGVAKEAL